MLATADKEDEFHIYKMNCSAMNGEPSYVLKTSCIAAEIALKMDSETPEGKDPAMNQEHAYMDGMHSHVKGFKSYKFMDIPPRNEACLAPCNNGVRKRRYRIYNFVSQFI